MEVQVGNAECGMRNAEWGFKGALMDLMDWVAILADWS
jgi:hypothetical protein